ncbi:MAG: YcxB family protein [Clostridia bacterium]|nr:YcxB family protein [Clostridia bacterium]
MVEFRQKFNEDKAYAATGYQAKKVIPVILVLSGLLIIFAVIGMVFGEDKEDFYSSLFILIIGVLCPALFFILLKIAQRSFNKSMRIMSSDTEEVYTFDENCFTINTKRGEVYNANVKSSYSLLYKVVETRLNYFLYISRAQTHVIDKSSLTQGTLLELNSYFASKLGAKFKCQK